MNRLVPLVLCCAALVLAACGEREDPTPTDTGADRLSVMLDYFPNADHAGLYAAMDTGAFEEVKLEVEARTPADPAEPLRLLQAGRVDLAISYEPEVLLARDRGARVIAIGALVQKPLTSIISIGKDPIRRAEDLEGKRIGTAGIPYQDAYLEAITKQAGISADAVRKVNVGFNLTPAMISGRVDATLGSFWNYEGVELERRDRKPTILKVDELGVPTYNELVVVVREDTAKTKGDVLRRFMQGLAQGHVALREDPNAGIDPLLAANKDLDRGLQRAAVDATLPVFFPEDDDKPFGWMDENAWLKYASWMNENGLLKRPEDPRRALTTEFLPGEGPQRDESQ